MAGALIRRGQFVVVATSGDYGKPRPALVVQSDLFAELPSAVICPLTTTLRGDAGLFRLEVEPSPLNGLREVSQIAIDKIRSARPSGKRTTPCFYASIARWRCFWGLCDL